MIEVLTGFPDNVVAFLGKGRITRGDYEKILIPTVEQALSRNRKLRCYYELGSQYTGFEAGAAWEDFKLGMEHLTRWERAAVVTDVEWMRVATNAVGFLMPMEVRVFANSERDQARSWITAP